MIYQKHYLFSLHRLKLTAVNNPSINVIIADDHTFFRQGFRLALSGRNDVHVIAEASNGKELYCLVEKHAPDVVITDVSMPEMGGIEVTQLIKKQYPNTKVIALSMFEDVGTIREMLLAGASAYLLKNADVTDIIAAIQTTHRGKFFVSTTTSHLLNTFIQYSVTNCALTKREAEILQMLFAELTSREIGERLYLSERTVEEHRKNLQKKTNTRNIVGLLKYALRHKIVKLDY